MKPAYHEILDEQYERIAQLEADRDALVRAWYECPEDSVPEILDNVFQDIEFKYRDITPWPPERK